MTFFFLFFSCGASFFFSCGASFFSNLTRNPTEKISQFSTPKMRTGSPNLTSFWVKAQCEMVLFLAGYRRSDPMRKEGVQGKEGGKEKKKRRKEEKKEKKERKKSLVASTLMTFIPSYSPFNLYCHR
jgi:hypothetical protein